MTMYIAHNGPLAATTALAVPTSYTAGAKVAIQLGIPSGQFIDLIAWGISFDEDPTAAAAANAVACEIASTATASTLTAHSTTTVKPWDIVLGRASSLTMSTTGTGYGAVAITSNTTLRYADRRFLSPTSSFDMMWPSDMRPRFGAAAAAEFVQLRLNSPITVNAHAYLIWEER